MVERWLPVVGWEGLYEVSDLGRVRSVAHTTMRRDGKRYTVAPLLRRQQLVRGYLVVGLVRADLQTTDRVHRLVLTAFVGSCPEGQQARHLDGDRTNNRLTNLAYGTAAQNAADRAAHGTTARGERAGNAKLTATDVAEIRRLRAGGATVASIAARFAVGTSQVSRITRGRSWIHTEQQ